MIKVNKVYISLLIFFSFQLQAKLILPTVNWVDSAIAEGVKKINTLPKNATDYSIIIDVAKFVNTNPNYAVTLQSNTWHYETGNSTPQNFSNDVTGSNELENQLAIFNNGRTDNVRLYSVFIKNIPFIINGKLNNFSPDTSISLNEQINLLIQNNPKDYSKLQAIFSHIITSIKNQSTKDALIYGVGHFYTKYKKGNHFQGFFCDYFDAKNTGPLADPNKINSLKAMILDQRKNEAYGNVRARSSLIISTLIDNIKCTIDNNCGDLKLPLDLATQTFFDDVIFPNRQPLLTTSIAPGTTNVELFDLSGIMDAQTEQNTLYSWVQVCNQKGFKLKVFLTDYASNPNLIRQVQQFKGTLSGADKTIFLWLHQSSDLKTYADFAVSDGVSAHFDKTVLYAGIDNYIKRSKANLQQLADLPGKMAEGLAVWINSNVKIPEKYYNTQATDYDPFFADMYTFGICGVNSNCDNFFGGIAGKVGLNINPSLLPQCHFAFVCGIWNGVIGQVSGVFELCGTLGQSTKRSEFFRSIKTVFTTPFDQTWQAIKTQLVSTYGTLNNPSITAHNYGILLANIAGCFVGTGEIKALLVGEKIVLDIAKFAKIARLFSKGFVGIGNKAVKLGNYLVEIVTDGGKIIIKQLKNGEQVINNAIDFATGSVQWDGQKLLALTPNGSFEMSLVDDVFDNNNNKIGKLYEYGNNHEPVFVGDNKESVLKGVASATDWLIILKTNTDFSTIYDNFVSGSLVRKFQNILSIEEEAILRFYTTNPGYQNLNQALRGEIPMTDFYRAQKNLMDQALSKIPNSSYNTSPNLLYRIENLTNDQINAIYQKGKNITNDHFTSSTYSVDAIRDAMKVRSHTVLIRIKGKNGKLIEDLSTLQAEKEILFKTGTQYKVNDVYSIQHPLIGQPGFNSGDDIIKFDGVNKDFDQIRVIELIEL